MLRRALEAILKKTGDSQGNDAGAIPRVVVEDAGDGEMVIEFISEIEMNDGGGGDTQRRFVDDIFKGMDSKVFQEVLRGAGFDVRSEDGEVKGRAGSDWDVGGGGK